MIGKRPATMSDPIHPASHDPSGPAPTRPERPALRASDVEREQVVDILRRATVITATSIMGGMAVRQGRRLSRAEKQRRRELRRADQRGELES